MTTLTPRERVLRSLDSLLPYLHGFVNQALEAAGYEGRSVPADIAPLAHAIKDEWRGVFGGRLDTSIRNYVHELLDIRNKLAHSKPFTDDEARRACDTIRLVSQAVSAPRGPDGTPATAHRTTRTVERVARPRTQRNVMRSMWARWGPDEERVILEYAAAEERGDAPRKSNEHGHTAEQYARALLNDGLKKGWLKEPQ